MSQKYIRTGSVIYDGMWERCYRLQYYLNSVCSLARVACLMHLFFKGLHFILMWNVHLIVVFAVYCGCISGDLHSICINVCITVFLNMSWGYRKLDGEITDWQLQTTMAPVTLTLPLPCMIRFFLLASHTRCLFILIFY